MTACEVLTKYIRSDAKNGCQSFEKLAELPGTIQLKRNL